LNNKPEVDAYIAEQKNIEPSCASVTKPIPIIKAAVRCCVNGCWLDGTRCDKGR